MRCKHTMGKQFLDIEQYLDKILSTLYLIHRENLQIMALYGHCEEMEGKYEKIFKDIWYAEE